MSLIAYLASQATLPGSPTRRSDAFEHDHMMDALRKPFAQQGYELIDVDWADETENWSRFDAAIIGTTWDYWDRPDQFVRTLERIGSRTRLFNDPDLVKWNSHKGYLRELEDKGARMIPTLWLDQVDAAAFTAAFAQLQTEDLVFKRQIGAGADGQFRLAPADTLPPMPHPMMVQPFLSAIQDEGEYSFIFIDGAFSHALIKQATTGDYRIQSTYGGYETAISPNPDDLDCARTVLGLLDDTPLYARVDMVRGADGQLLLMELELIEPYLYPLEGPQLGTLMAQAVKARLG